ncbi:MAG TPA: hypothetical protein VFS08_12495 [Gemmatimonadaceae bacterium]|nr:hypothetical protein [Gemmatimonadaceae bacterium]
MHVIAHYQIADPAAFRAPGAAPVPDRPAHWRLIASVPARDGSACFDLWWADSAEALEQLLRPAVGHAGRVECHEVDEENAMGLAGPSVTIIRVAEPRRPHGAGRLSDPPGRP